MFNIRTDDIQRQIRLAYSKAYENIFHKPPMPKVIFNDNATILLVCNGGDKTIVNCAEDDIYDEEKGLLIALAKMNGYKYKDIQKMLKNAKRCKSKKRGKK